MSEEDLSHIQQKLRDDIGEIFLDLRLEERLTQRQMAEKLDIPQYVITRLERGTIDMKLSSLQKYMSKLGYKVELRFDPKE